MYLCFLCPVLVLISNVQSFPVPGRAGSHQYREQSLNKIVPVAGAPPLTIGCKDLPKKYTGAKWWGECIFAGVLVLLTGLLAGLTLAVMSVEMTRLRVWMKTGGRKKRSATLPL